MCQKHYDNIFVSISTCKHKNSLTLILTFKNTRKYRIVVLKYNQIDFKNAIMWKELPNSQFQILQNQVEIALKCQIQLLIVKKYFRAFLSLLF